MSLTHVATVARSQSCGLMAMEEVIAIGDSAGDLEEARCSI
jgi:hydroxymethylpyrimidine pyrophosphatase-like HAD family hydrolase